MIKGLRFTVKSVRAYNKAHKEENDSEMKAFDNLVAGLMDLDLDSIVELVKIGMSVDEDKADELVQLELEETKCLIKVSEQLRWFITEMGFTPWAKSVNIEKHYNRLIEKKKQELENSMETQEVEEVEIVQEEETL